MSEKGWYKGREGRALPRPDEATPNHHSDPLTSHPVNANDHDDPLATRSASPSSAGPTRAGDPRPGPGRMSDRPSAAAQLRDPDRYQIINEHGRGGLGRVSR